MEYVRFGSTGLTVSRLCLGAMTYGDPAWRSWVLSEDAGRPFIKRALEYGINFFDTADMYSLGRSEEVLGRALRDFARRDRVVIATKVFNPMSDDPNDRGLSRKHVMASIDASLKRLGTDYVDLYQIHRWDPQTPIEETLRALDDIVRAGKALYVGASSTYAWEFAKALYLADASGWTRFVSMQNHYNLVYREEEREMMPLCRQEGIAVIPWSPRRHAQARAGAPGHRAREDRQLRARSLLRRRRLRRRRDRRGRRGGEKGHAGAGRARVAAAATGRDGADRRRVEDGPPRSGRRRARRDADRRGDWPPRGAVRAAPGARDLTPRGARRAHP
jgi:aryl-alcohol dehydrogenase-like predicted oxidoreductase